MSAWVLMERDEDAKPRHVYDPSGDFKHNKITNETKAVDT